MMGPKITPLVQAGGVIIETEHESEFFTIDNFDKILKINLKLKSIQFFAHFYMNKFFYIWKKCSKKKRRQRIIDLIQEKIKVIY